MGDPKDILKLFIENGIQCSIAEFKGSSIAIDVSSWLQKALNSYIEDIIDIDFQDYMLYVDFLLYRTRNFRMAGVEPVMVFSGHGNSLKAGKQCQQMVDNHEAAVEQGKRLLECMRSTSDTCCRQKIRHEAIACFQRGLRVTQAVETNCIAALRRVGVMVVVAPYDTDAQLASLCRSGICQAVLTEDPNLILYGAISDKPFPILYNFDSTGMAQLVSLSNLASSLAKRSRVLSQHTNKKKKNTTSTSLTATCGVSSSLLPSSSTNPMALPPNPLLHKQSEHDNNEQLFTFLCQLLHTVRGRRKFIQMCLLLGNDYIEPLFEGITATMAQHLIIKFSDLHQDLRFAAIKKYVDSPEGMAHLIGLSSPGMSMNLSMVSSSAAPRSPMSSKSTYLDRLCRVEIMLYYHPVFDPKLKNVRNYSTPNYAPSDVATNSVDHTQSYPAVSYLDIFRLGHGAHLLFGIPAEKVHVISIATLCEGAYGMRDYQLIKPSLPWEHTSIAQFSKQRANRSSPQRVGGGGTVAHKGVWHNRAQLVRSLSAYISSPGISPNDACDKSSKNSNNSTESSSISCSSLNNTVPPPSVPGAESSVSVTRVRNLLSPPFGASAPVVSRPPPSSAVFQHELDRFQREYNRLVEAYHAAARKRVTASSTSIAVADTCYKSPPTRKQDSVVKKKTVTCSPNKGLLNVEVESTYAPSSAVNNNKSVLVASSLDNVTTELPVRTPPGPISSSSGPAPLSPDLMRLATVSSIHSPVIERKSGQSRSIDSRGSSIQKSNTFPSVESISSKRKHIDSADSLCKKKKLVVTSIKSYFKSV